MLRAALVALIASLASGGCDPTRPGDSSSSSGTPGPAPVAATTADVEDYARGCLTLRDVAASDVVRIVGPTLYYLEEASGLWIVDVSEPARPKPRGHVATARLPFRLFVRDRIAWVVELGTDAAATAVLAIDVADPERPRVLGTRSRPGAAHDAALVGGVLYLLRDDGPDAIVESFVLRRGALDAIDSARLDGHATELAASPSGLAAVSASGDRVHVTWFDLPPEALGVLARRGSASVAGGVPLRPAEGSRVADADEGQSVRLVSCATSACASSDATYVQTIDFSGAGGGARITPPERLFRHGGFPATRFVDDRLYAAAPAGAGESVLLAVRVYPTPKVVGSVRLEGSLSTLAPRGSLLVALGRVGERIVVHGVDVTQAAAPRRVGTVRFGDDWTWSVAETTEAALSFDPRAGLLAVPFNAFRASERAVASTAQLVELGARGPALGPALPTDHEIERAVWLDGQLLTVGPRGVSVVGAAPAADLRIIR